MSLMSKTLRSRTWETINWTLEFTGKSGPRAHDPLRLWGPRRGIPPPERVD